MRTNNPLLRASIAAACSLLLMSSTACVFISPGEDDNDAETNGNATDNDNKSSNTNTNTNTNTNGPTETDFDCSSTGEVSEDIEEDTVFTPGDNDCLVFTDTVQIDDGALLTIEPGVVLQFEQDTGLNVREGRMTAAGTADNPIIFTGTEEERGWWKGVQYRDTRSSDNILDHVIIEYGGGDEHSLADGPANLVLNTSSGDPHVSIDNTVLQHSGSAGFHAEEDAEIKSFENNTLTANAVPAVISTSHLGMLSDSSLFSGNDDDYVDVQGGRINDGDHTWPAIDVPYRVFDDIDIRDNAHVDIDAGAEFEFDSNLGLSVRDGTMSVNGTADDLVYFTGVEPQPGWWIGVQYRDTRSHQNQVNHAVIEYGGGDEHSLADGPANLVLNTSSGEPEVSVDNTILQHSGNVGLYVEEDSILTSFENNTLTENANGAATVHTQELGMLSDSTSYEGNGEDYLWVPDGRVNQGEHTWPDIGISYGVLDDIGIRDEAHVDIDPGATFAFDEHVGLEVRDGTLSVNGKEGNTVDFKQLGEDISAYWKGIQYRDTRSVDNRLEHVTIRGGSSQTFSLADDPGALVFNDSSGEPEVALNNVEITDFSPNPAVAIEEDAIISECSGLSGFGATDVVGDGTGHFITSCGL